MSRSRRLLRASCYIGVSFFLMSFVDGVHPLSGWIGLSIASMATIAGFLIREESNVDSSSENDLRRELEPSPEKVEENIQELTRLINTGSGDRVECLFRRGAWQFFRHNYFECEADMVEVRLLDDDNWAEATLFVFESRMMQGNFDTDEAELDRAINECRRDPTKSQSVGRGCRLRASLRGMREDWSGSYSDAVEALKLEGPYGVNYYLKGVAEFYLKRWRDAKADLEQATKLEPNHADALHHLVILMATAPDPALRDGRAAVTTALRACELTQWENWPVITGLAAAYAEAGDFEKAVQFAERSLELAPPEARVARQERLDQFRRGIPYRWPE